MATEEGEEEEEEELHQNLQKKDAKNPEFGSNKYKLELKCSVQKIVG